MNEPPFLYDNLKINSSKIQNYINKNYLIKRKLSIEENIADFNFIEKLLDFCGSISKFVIDKKFAFGIFYAQIKNENIHDNQHGWMSFVTDYYIMEPVLICKNSDNEYNCTSLISKRNMNLYLSNKVEEYIQIYKPLLSKHNILPLYIPLQKIMLITYHLYSKQNSEFSDIIGIIQQYLTDIYLNLIINMANESRNYKPSFKYMLANAITSGIKDNYGKPSRQYIRKYILSNWIIDINIDENAKQAIKDLISAPNGEPKIIVNKLSYFASEELLNYTSHRNK